MFRILEVTVTAQDIDRTTANYPVGVREEIIEYATIGEQENATKP
jgi:hypothetical protein